ncbi:hypothetical protein [Rhodoferax koreensis]|uniref:hypothetical protein n=1 Tax=Rhodoferax koreensis TaxID=1842727 RepID=UPI0012FF7811|nr:hypothetical protein [Rhodoferax koreense]
MNIKLVGGPGDGVVLKAARPRNDWIWQHNGRNFYYKAQARPDEAAPGSAQPAEPVLFLFQEMQTATELSESRCS